MEREEFNEKLDAFLDKHGYDSEEVMDNKDRLRALRNIAMISENDMIVLEQQYTSNRIDKPELEEDVRVSDRSNYSNNFDDYVSTIHNLEVNVHNARYYIANIKGIIREERRENFRKKVKSLFRK